MENFYFNKPTTRNWWNIAAFFVAFILIALLMSSCKSRKVQKEYAKSIDKSSQTATVKEVITTNDYTAGKVQNSVKENAASEVKNDFEESKSGSVLKIEEETKTSTYDSLGRLKYVTENKKTTTQESASSNKKDKGQNLSNYSKTDSTKIDWIEDHSRLQTIDSVGETQNDTVDINKSKVVDAKIDWLRFGVGTGVLILIIFCGLIWYRNKVKKGFKLP